MRTANVEKLEVRRLLAGLEPDLVFGEGGLATTGPFSGHFFATRTLADGKILAVGNGSGPSGPGVTTFLGSDDPLVARFNADGSPDTSFDEDGMLFLPQNDGVLGTTDAAFGPDGKAVLLHGVIDEHEIRVFRFNADGTPDQTFGDHGKAQHSVGALGFTYSSQVAVQGDGKIVFAFRGDTTSGSRMYLNRLNADGSVDAGFRGGFPTSPAMATGLSSIWDVAVGPDGKIYVAGDLPRTKFVTVPGGIMRFNSDGTVDTSYGGGDGFAEVVNPNVDDAPDPRYFRIAFDGSGRTLTSWQSSFATGQSVLLTRFTTSGAVDKSFGGGDGEVTLDPLDSGATPKGLVVDSKGRILGGISTGGLRWLFRLLSDGSPDMSFGPDGRSILNRGILDPDSLTLNSDGSVLVGGQQVEPFHAAVARFVADSPDVVLNSAGHLLVNGTDGADSIRFDQVGDQVVVHRNGVDTKVPFANVKLIVVFPSAGGDVITLSFAMPASLIGGSGNDTITASAGDVTIYGMTGNDKIFCGAGHHVIDGGRGNDRIVTGSGRDSIDGGDGADVISTGAGSDTISGGDGNDSITCRGGNDRIYTGNGNDTVHGGAGNDLIQDYPDPVPVGENQAVSSVGHASGTKIYFGEEGNDLINGSKEGDIIFGNGGRDTIYGDVGSDSISGGGGSDEMHGGSQNIFDASDASDRDTISGGEDDDSIAGSAGGDTIYGDAGNDTIDARNGDDLVLGGVGNDGIEGGYGKNLLYGNGGNDVISGGPQTDVIRGNAGRDTLRGNGGNDRVYGGDGNDRLDGNNGDDQLFGEGGNDRLFGDDAGKDSLNGGAGNDLLVTKDGSIIDALFGDAGRDTSIADKNDVLNGIEVKQ